MSDHDHDHDHDDEGEDDDSLVTLEDAEGNAQDFVFLATVKVDDEIYALLTPAVEEGEEEGETTEIFVFTYEEDEDGGEIFGAVEDEAIVAKVQAEAEKLFTEADEEEA
jgi:uncharacterized protein YrzB (UPF0473 family)